MLWMLVVPILLFLPYGVWTYEAPEDKQDVFAVKACPAFLTFVNVAYLAGATVELLCHCKPPEVMLIFTSCFISLVLFSESFEMNLFDFSKLFSLNGRRFSVQSVCVRKAKAVTMNSKKPQTKLWTQRL